MENLQRNTSTALLGATFLHAADSLEKRMQNIQTTYEDTQLKEAAKYLVEFPLNSSYRSKTGIDIVSNIIVAPIFYQKFLSILPENKINAIQQEKMSISEYAEEYTSRVYNAVNSKSLQLLTKDEIELTIALFKTIGQTLLTQLYREN